MSQDVICGAIGSRNVIRFYYQGGSEPGFREVEPHQVGYTKAGRLALSGWYLSGASKSGTGPGFKLYLLDEISGLEVLPTQFAGPRPEFVRGGGKLLHSVQCEL